MNQNNAQLLKQKGLRVTPARVAILRILEKNSLPISAEEILANLRVNKTTVYRELEALQSEGIIIEVHFDDRKKRYELANRRHHHHLICTGCKSVTDVEIPDGLGTLESNLEKLNQFQIKQHSLEFFGLCASCQN